MIVRTVGLVMCVGGWAKKGGEGFVHTLSVACGDKMQTVRSETPFEVEQYDAVTLTGELAVMGREAFIMSADVRPATVQELAEFGVDAFGDRSVKTAASEKGKIGGSGS